MTTQLIGMKVIAEKGNLVPRMSLGRFKSGCFFRLISDKFCRGLYMIYYLTAHHTRNKLGFSKTN